VVSGDLSGRELKGHKDGEPAHSHPGGAVLFLFGAFCALWAQNTNRNAWLWFFLGLVFSFITVIVLLVKNSNDRKQFRRQSESS
jgi:hypothetical protein